jgi:hypothetical protein
MLAVFVVVIVVVIVIMSFVMSLGQYDVDAVAGFY